MSYATDARRAMTEKALTADDVARLDYRGVAALCGIKLGEKGESPADFYWDSVRDQIIADLKAEHEEEYKVEIEAAMVAAANVVNERLGKAPITSTDEAKR